MINIARCQYKRAHCLHQFSLPSANTVDKGTNATLLASSKAVCLVYSILMCTLATAIPNETIRRQTLSSANKKLFVYLRQPDAYLPATSVVAIAIRFADRGQSVTCSICFLDNNSGLKYIWQVRCLLEGQYLVVWIGTSAVRNHRTALVLVSLFPGITAYNLHRVIMYLEDGGWAYMC